MGNRHIDWALELSLKPGPKLVLLILANRANKADQCWPTLGVIHSETGLSRRAVIENVSRLIRSGLIKKNQRGPQSDMFTLILDGEHVQIPHRKKVQKQHPKKPKGVQIPPKEVQKTTKRGAENDIPPTPPLIREPKGTHNNPKAAKPKKPVQPVVVLPEWLDVNLWAEFKEFRKRKDRRPLSVKAEQLNLNKLAGFREQGMDPVEIINTTIERNWASFFPPKGQKKTKFTEPYQDFSQGSFQNPPWNDVEGNS